MGKKKQQEYIHSFAFILSHSFFRIRILFIYCLYVVCVLSYVFIGKSWKELESTWIFFECCIKKSKNVDWRGGRRGRRVFHWITQRVESMLCMDANDWNVIKSETSNRNLLVKSNL